MAQDAAPAPKETPPAAAQPAPPAAAQDQLPPVDVVQPKQKAEKKAAPAKKTVAKKSAPKAPPPAEPTPVAADAAVDAAPAATAAPLRPGTGTATTGTVNMSPLAGSDLPIEKVPGPVGRASSEDFARTGNISPQDVLQATVPAIVISDAQGNVFQRSVQYRGYEASPVNGVAQGLAVYQNGTRINEVFGDVVNWDFIPSNAIDSITVLGANPVYGLNAIGGAIGITMRDGFSFQGAEFDTRFGSYGRIQGSAAAGAKSGNWAIFGAIEGVQDDGFRDFSESEVKRMYADLGYRTNQSEFHLSFTGAKNEVGVTAAAPNELLDLGRELTFTSPQINENEMAMVQLSGAVKATETLGISGQMYYRRFKQDKIDGNILDVDPNSTAANGCDATTQVCVEDEGTPGQNEALESENGPIAAILGARYGVIDHVKQDNESFGTSLQAVDRSQLFGFRNQFLVGGSFDHGEVKYTTQSEFGTFGPKFVVNGRGIILAGDDFAPRDIETTSDYAGIFFSNTTDLTDRLALTVGGRYNYARLELDNKAVEPGEPDKLSGTHTFIRFNPNVGLTYQIFSGLTAYGGYSEANRAPTAAELSCADPDAPCLIESLLVADPPLEQVVSKTFELGLRGKIYSFGAGNDVSWSLGGFHSKNQDDIISIAAPQSGRGFFDNVGETERKGIEAGLQYQSKSLFTYATYSYTDAEFRENLTISSPDNPAAQLNCPDVDYTVFPAGEGPTCVNVHPGDRLPGIPKHKFKAGFNYYITSKWQFGADLVAISNQIFFGDEGNDNDPLPGYAKVNLHTAYDLTDKIQIYGLIDNVFDTEYGLFGTYFNSEAGNYAAGREIFAEDYNKAQIPAPPITAYGGVKVRF